MQSSFLRGQRLNLGPSPKIFSNPKENPQKFYEELRILIGAYNLELSGFYQFIHMTLGPGDT